MVSKRNRKLYPRYSALQHGEKALLPPNIIIHLPCHTQREPLPQAAHQHFPILPGDVLEARRCSSVETEEAETISFPFWTKIYIILVSRSHFLAILDEFRVSFESQQSSHLQQRCSATNVCDFLQGEVDSA